MDNRNEPTDMDLIDSPRRTPTPPPLSACEQILQTKAQLQKMETFKSSSWPASLNFKPCPITTRMSLSTDVPFRSFKKLKKQLTWRFSLPSDSNIEEITGSQNAIPVVTPKPPSATGPTPSGNQNPVSTLPPPVMLRITETRLELQCKLKQRQASFNFANILNLHIAFSDSPTRFGHNSANTIDFALIKNFYYPYTIKSINDLYSDHNPVFLNFDFKLKVESSNPRAITTNWKDFRINLNNNFSLFNYYPNNINNTNDLETKITEFTEAVVATHSHASQPIVNAHRNYTPNHINQLIKHKNNLRKRYQQTLNPFYKTLCNRAQANLKKELKIYSNDTWNARLEALNTTDNSLWEAQRFLKNKRSQIPTLNCATGMAVTDPQKANLLANTIKNNFIENNRMQDNYDQDDEVVTSAVNTFLSSPFYSN
ncbi:RNA-directed DNA polymerase from mobile element jockey [Trichonephila clavipes]|nr:RNA-directed DNA polymerase from mobile element jockey [Trichonephila clavipes]